jgi:hypothetical protein
MTNSFEYQTKGNPNQTPFNFFIMGSIQIWKPLNIKTEGNQPMIMLYLKFLFVLVQVQIGLIWKYGQFILNF